MTHYVDDQTTRVVDVFVDSGYPQPVDVITNHVVDLLDSIHHDGYNAGVSVEMGSGTHEPFDADAALAGLHDVLSHGVDVFVNNRELVINALEDCWRSGYAEGSWDC